jgi:Tfp pilus assembly protein PilF
LQTYEQAHALAPNNPLVNFNRGVAYSEQGRHAEAQAALSRALAKEGTLPPLGFYHLGKSFAAQNAWGQALDYFHREMSISPDFVPLHEAMAHAYEASGDIAAAQAAWERVLGIKGSHREARRKIAALSKISNVRR